MQHIALKSCPSPEPFIIEDELYAEEASAPPTTHVEEKEKSMNEVVVPLVTEEPEESTKTIKMIGTQTKKEYQREYQRNYRKKQKELTMNL